MVNHPEIGRELTASELKPWTIVVTRREDKNLFISLWVTEIGQRSVMFEAHELTPPVVFIVRRHQDDTLTEVATGKRLFVYQYLGEP